MHAITCDEWLWLCNYCHARATVLTRICCDIHSSNIHLLPPLSPLHDSRNLVLNQHNETQFIQCMCLACSTQCDQTFQVQEARTLEYSTTFWRHENRCSVDCFLVSKQEELLCDRFDFLLPWHNLREVCSLKTLRVNSFVIIYSLHRLEQTLVVCSWFITTMKTSSGVSASWLSCVWALYFTHIQKSINLGNDAESLRSSFPKDQTFT